MVPYPKRPGRPLTHIPLPRTPVPVRSCADPSRPYNDGVMSRTPVPSPARPRADLSHYSKAQARHAGRRAAPFPRVNNSATPQTVTPYPERPCTSRTATSHPVPPQQRPGTWARPARSRAAPFPRIDNIIAPPKTPKPAQQHVTRPAATMVPWAPETTHCSYLFVQRACHHYVYLVSIK